jgi:hypothetical protein
MASLLGLSRAAFQRSKQNTEWKQRVRVAGLVGALLGVVLPASVVTISSLLAVGALILEVAAWWFSREASKAHRLAEQARRSNVLLDAFGKTSETLDLSDLHVSFDSRLTELATKLDEGNYYASEQKHGLERLKDNLQESAFWTKHLFQKSADRTLRSLLVKFSFVILALIVSIFLGAYDSEHLFAKLIVVTLSAILALGDLDAQLDWQQSARLVESVDRRLDKHQIDEKSLLAIWADYNAAVEKAPVVPDKVYRSEKDRLNEEWKLRKTQEKPPI